MNPSADTKDVPILLMLFNRPETTQKVFEKLRQAKPGRIFIAADGPRSDRPEDVALCAAVRSIFDKIDWDCSVHKNYREVNVGVYAHWPAALEWFFEHVDRGVVLEDDCVPDNSFFDYCAELLEKYKDDESIMHINGTNLQFGTTRGDYSYYFSRYACVWGWATWRRAWKKYDQSMSSFPEFRDKNKLERIIENKVGKRYWATFFEKSYLGIFQTPDVRWTYAIWDNDSLCISPNKNLISNIGFGLSAEHTFFKDKSLGQETFDIGALSHPHALIPDKVADEYVFRNTYHRTFFQKLLYVTAKKFVRLFRWWPT